MRIDGKAIAENMKHKVADKVAAQECRLVLAVVVVGHDPVMENFIRIKKNFAEACGIHIEEHRFEGTIETGAIVRKVEELALDDFVHGIVVQLPLPSSVDTETILGTIPVGKDIDVMSPVALASFKAGTSAVLPPVVGALKKILKERNVNIDGKRAVIVGRGPLVGSPAAMWLSQEGADVTILGRKDKEIFKVISSADILVLGAGVPGLVTLDMIPEGVVLLDAGTSETAGELRGDADPGCEEKCSVFTPVPGGIGPITVAMLFKNLITLHE